ncbi:MAG: YaaR family protein [Treponema sp.]|nr:YaaR family protein [Treponema sp.]
MAEIDSLSSSYLYAGIQSSTRKAQKEKEAEKTAKSSKIKFSELINQQSKTNESKETLFPKEIEGMEAIEAALYLRDQAELASNQLSAELTMDNLMIFKDKIRQFLTFVAKNNFQVKTTTLINRRTKQPVKRSPLPIFSSYEIPAQVVTKTSFNIIDEKLDQLTRDMLELQQTKDNLKLLEEINEIKGMIINLLD